MKIRFKLVIASLIFFIVFSPISFSALIEYSQASNYEEITEDQEWATDKVVDKDIFINEEATLTIKKGVTITFNNRNINVYGKMIVAGTMKNPVIFKKVAGSRNYSIAVWQGASLDVRNADISGGGGFYPWVARNNSFINTTHAEYGSYQGAFHAGGGILSVQGCNFHDNGVAVYADSESAGKVVVNRSKFFNNSLIDMGYPTDDQNYKVNGRNNWWGSSEGPSNKICNDDGVCKIKGAVDFSNWLTSENFHDPVVVIPGIFGSQKEDGIWKIDPIFHVYDNLIDEFKNNGYVVGKDLFIFPYEWRDSNVENAVKLKYKISEIKTIANWPKVDVVAHSMGGLLTRQYIESGAYQGDIDQLITLGTPNNGSPEIYPLWEAGESIGTVQMGMKKFLAQEMEEGKYANMFEYIRNRPISSAQELLPNYEYLYDLDNKRPMIYPTEYPVNAFLDNLNKAVNVKKMINVEYTKITGKAGSDTSTISQFNVVKVDMGGLWKHGYPLSFEIPLLSGRGAIRGSGDGTVPLSSGKSVEVPADNYLELNSAHTDLPTKAQKDVLETLTGVRPASEVKDSMIKNMLQVFVHSPIDIQIISPSGLKVGKNFETGGQFNQIEGAYYTGYDTENEFITIPNPEDGKYRILTEGTGSGEYHIEAAKISENADEPGNAVESVVTFDGIAKENERGEFKAEISGDAITKVDDEKIAPETTIEISGNEGANSWLIGDAKISLSAEDNENGSGVDFVSFSLDRGATWERYSQPIDIAQEGTVDFQYFATDKKGNNEEIKIKTIKIDKTAPEAKLVFNPNTQKLDVVGIDNLNQNVSVEIQQQIDIIEQKSDKKSASWFFGWPQKEKEKEKITITTAKLTDQAGHETKIVWENKKDKSRRIDLSIVSVSYNGLKMDVSGVSLQYKWMLNWIRNKYVLFASHLNTQSASIESHYISGKNQTWLMEKPKEIADDDSNDDAEKRPTVKKLPGMLIPSLTTEKGAISIGY